jgi:hypothetical protein
MSPGAHARQKDSVSQKVSFLVNQQVLERFRTAVMWRYGSMYENMGREVNRALADRTAVLMAEAQTVNPMVMPGEQPVDELEEASENVFDGRERRERPRSADGA